MLYIIGLGLGNEKDITLRGLEAVKNCSKVYIESYTSLLSFGLSSDGLSTLVRTHIPIPSLSFFFFSSAEQFLGENKWVLVFDQFMVCGLLGVQEKLYGKPVTLADRETVEEKADAILEEAQESDVAFLVVGDPFGY